MLISDTFDSVGTKSVSKESRALESFTCSDLDVWIYILQVVACSKCSATTCAGSVTTYILRFYSKLIDDFENCRTCYFIVPEIVLELLELVEDDNVLASFSVQFMALVEDFLDVGLTAWSSDDFACYCLEPVESFLGHVFRKDSDGLTSQKS